MDSLINRYKVEEQDDFRGWVNKMPYIKFPNSWEVKVIPPFGGAVVRFQVKKPSGDWKSVYLDCYDRLGYMGYPYWEVYPVDGDVRRCEMNDVDELLKLIKRKG